MVHSRLPGSAPSPRIARQTSSTSKRLTRYGAGQVESLEQRTLLSVSATVETLLNVSKMRENQTEASIAIDPTNPNRLFIASNMASGRDPDLGAEDPIPGEDRLFGASSTDAEGPASAVTVPAILADPESCSSSHFLAAEANGAIGSNSWRSGHRPRTIDGRTAKNHTHGGVNVP